MPRRTIPRPFPADLPGVTAEWLARANNCSPRTIRRWRTLPPPDGGAANDILMRMTPETAVQMALVRPPRGSIPFWSRLAIAELAARGATYSQLMREFRVGRSTVYRAIHRMTRDYCHLSGVRLRTTSHAAAVPRPK
jgi:transposase-like protein